jgi:hypothetical protein
LVVAVSTTLNEVPALWVPAAGATMKVGVGVLAENPPVGPDVQPARRASTVYVYDVDGLSPESVHECVVAPTVQTVAVVGAVRRTTY